MTLIASAGVSAVVGAVVSLLAISTVTTRRDRAERREAARVEVRDCVAEVENQLARYLYTGGTAPRTMDGPMLTEDLQHVIRIRRAAHELPNWRRAAIDFRLGRIFGRGWVLLARDYPSQYPDDGEAALTTSMAGLFKGYNMPDPRHSMIHRIYATPVGGGDAKALRKELRRLARAR